MYIHIYISTQAWRIFSIQSLRFIHTVGALHQAIEVAAEPSKYSVNAAEKSKGIHAELQQGLFAGNGCGLKAEEEGRS